MEFLPITTKEKLVGKFIREFRASLVLFIPYITLYIIPAKNYNAKGIRGEMVILMAVIIIWSCIRCAANYERKYELLKLFFGVVTLISIILVSIDIVSNIGGYENFMFGLLGNFYVGIIVGVISLISIYYVNLRFIKLHGKRRNVG
jgi:hypothetical protein